MTDETKAKPISYTQVKERLAEIFIENSQLTERVERLQWVLEMARDGLLNNGYSSRSSMIETINKELEDRS